MVELNVVGDKVVFEVEGWDKLWSLRSRLEIPLEHIHGAHADPKPAMGWFDGLKLAGTEIPHFSGPEHFTSKAVSFSGMSTALRRRSSSSWSTNTSQVDCRGG